MSDKISTKAAKCKLQYQGSNEKRRIETEWILKNTVQIKESAKKTIFTVIGFHPGGMAGLKEDRNGKRQAFFFMFNHK